MPKEIEEEQPDDIGADIAAAMEEPVVEAQEGPARDDAGKFAKKAEEAPEQAPEAAPEADEADVIKPPASWSPAAKAAFMALGEEAKVIQLEVMKRERDIDKGFQAKATELKRYEPIEAVIAPHRERWQAHGISEDQAIGRLLAADGYLRENPIAAIQELAQNYGVDLRMFAQGGVAQQPSALQPVMQELNALKQQFQAQAQAAAQAQRSTVEKTIEAFSKSADAIYFADVEDDMTALIAAGRVQGDTLEERIKNAYDMATWARPDIRKLIQADQSKPKQETAAERQKVANARKAAGSITGSTNGAAVLAPPDESIQDTIRRAMVGGV